ncbi:MAG: hypothetical protein DHS20C09_15630 [marine bacterium B5-7]|nr:MAG: hypothetical protein DHS20C09_15630 [marine bacterium B5-7]
MLLSELITVFAFLALILVQVHFAPFDLLHRQTSIHSFEESGVWKALFASIFRRRVVITAENEIFVVLASPAGQIKPIFTQCTDVSVLLVPQTVVNGPWNALELVLIVEVSVFALVTDQLSRLLIGIFVRETVRQFGEALLLIVGSGVSFSAKVAGL